MKNIPENPDIIAVNGSFGIGGAFELARANPEKKVLVLLHESEYVKAAKNSDLSHFFKKTKINIPPNICFKEADKFEGQVGKLFFSAFSTKKTRTSIKKLLNQNPEMLDKCDILVGSKGIELPEAEDVDEKNLPCQIIEDSLVAHGKNRESARKKIGYLIGGTLATTLATGKRAGADVGGERDFQIRVAKHFEGSNLKIHFENVLDPISLQIGGAMKNVFAILTGFLQSAIAKGHPKVDDSSAGLLYARCVAEFKRLARACGAEEKALAKDSGLTSDLILSMQGGKTRNFLFGNKLGEIVDWGEKVSPENIKIAKGKKTVEGLDSASALFQFAKNKNVATPRTEAAVNFLEGKITPNQLIQEIFSQPTEFYKLQKNNF